MRHEADKDTWSTVARACGALVGLALVLAAVAPFDGVPPRPGSDDLAPAQIEVRALAAGLFDVSPVNTVLETTNFPLPGQRGGPSVAVRVRNIGGIPLRVRVRLFGLSPTLDRAAKVRGSVAGTVVLNGPLGTAANWSRPSKPLRPGQSSTLRLRFKLLEGAPPEAWRGHLDVRQIEFDAVREDGSPVRQGGSSQQQVVPDDGAAPPGGTAPTPTSPTATTPAQSTPEKLGPPLPSTGTVMESAAPGAYYSPPSTPATTPPGTTP